MPHRYSHPASAHRARIPLRDHLQHVATRAARLAPDGTTPDGTPLSEVVTRIALVHDFGKLTTWFQAHIGVQDGATDGPQTHAPLGAVVAYYVLDQSGVDGEDPLAGFIAVARHHGHLPDTGSYVRKTTIGLPGAGDIRRKNLRRQVADIDAHAPELADTLIREATDDRGSWRDVAARVRTGRLFETIFDQVAGFGSSPQLALHPVSTDFYATVLQVWSILVLADKTGAANAPADAYDCHPPRRDRLATHINNLDGDAPTARERRINAFREDARSTVLENARVFAARDDGAVATLTLPTGMGKTLTGLNAAMALRDATDRNRIVYALPYTSVIDQVADELRRIYADAEGDGGKSAGPVTAHHHLADPRLEFAGKPPNHGGTSDIERLLGESWRGGLIVTTFVQLFESLAGPTNTQSMKLPALYDSVIVLDEPQGLPLDWWPVTERLVDLLVDKFGALVIAMTATQPRLFGPTTPELVDDPERYYRSLDRVEYTLDDSFLGFDDAGHTLGYDEAAATVVDETGDTESTLVVCNTIDSARELTRAIDRHVETVDMGGVLSDLLGEHDDGETLADAAARRDGIPLYHLSTRLRPCDRLSLIESIHVLTTRMTPLFVVSTPLLEAGVDLSFDNVYRDFAPADSLVQAAGRCNRSHERHRGQVTLWWLGPPGEGSLTPAEAVYNYRNESRLSITWEAITTVRDHATSLPEPTMAWDAVQDYYRRLDDRNVGRDRYVEFVDDAEAARLGGCSLIDQEQAVDVIVCRQPANRELVTEDIPDALERGAYDEFEALMDQTKPLRVSVPTYRGSDEVATLRELDSVPFAEDSHLRWLDATRRRNPDCFDETAGLIVPDDSIERRFL